VIQPEDVVQALEELRPFFRVLEEVQLCDFGESANSGPWVKFRLLAPESLEPYRGQDRSGRNARTGKRYTLMLIELNDQEEPVQAEPKTYKLSQIAGAKCNDPNFRAWLASEYGEPMPDAEAAAAFIRQLCGIESRSYLDTIEHAATIFRTLLADYDRACGSPG
jgi:hypothetical protein